MFFWIQYIFSDFMLYNAFELTYFYFFWDLCLLMLNSRWLIRHHKMICDVCNSTEVEHCNDQVLCAQCGKVLEEETFVNVVQFLENTRGGSSVCGKVVGADGKEIWMNFFVLPRACWSPFWFYVFHCFVFLKCDITIVTHLDLPVYPIKYDCWYCWVSVWI